MYTESINKEEKLARGAKILKDTTIGSIWRVSDSDLSELNWFKVNKRRFGYRVKCEKTKTNFKSGAKLAAKIAKIKYGAFKAERDVFLLASS